MHDTPSSSLPGFETLIRVNKRVLAVLNCATEAPCVDLAACMIGGRRRDRVSYVVPSSFSAHLPSCCLSFLSTFLDPERNLVRKVASYFPVEIASV